MLNGAGNVNWGHGMDDWKYTVTLLILALYSIWRFWRIAVSPKSSTLYITKSVNVMHTCILQIVFELMIIRIKRASQINSIH